MFEIPDDDDLFGEENLGDVLHNISHQGHGQQKQDQTDSIRATSNDVFPTLSESGQTAAALTPPVAEGQSSNQSGSPKTKKMRVLTDVNCLTVSTAGDVQKCRVDESSGSVRAAGVSGCVSSAHTALSLLTHPTEGDGTLLPRRRSLRKFPGPAGILPPAKPSDLVSIMRKSPGTSPEVVSADSGNKPEEEGVCSSQATGEMLGGAAWQALVADLQPDTDKVLTKFSVRAMVHKASRRQLPKGKVPLMVGVLESIDFQGADASVVLRDPTGQMQGTLHREAVKDFSIELQTGAAMVLRQVSVISPSSRTHYLNITSGNIVAIYPAHGDRAPTVLPTSPEHPSVGQPCQEVMKHCVHAAEMELQEAVSAAKEAALRRLRQRGSPAHASSPRGNSSASSSGLFSNTPFQGARGTVTRPFTPPVASRTAPSSAGGGGGTAGFSDRKAACGPPQMRTPTPSHSTSGYGGGRSGGGISGANSSTPRGPHVSKAQQTAGSRYVNGSPVTRQSKSSSSGGGSGWSSGHQPNSYRLQPPTPGDTHWAPGVRQVSQTGISASPTNSARIPSSGLGGPSVLYSSSTTMSSVRLGSSSVPSDPPHGNSNSQTSSQQSKWSFKRKMTEPVGQTKQGDANANSEGKAPRLQAGNPAHRLQSSAVHPSGHSGTAVTLPMSASSAQDNTGPAKHSAVNSKETSSMWDDDLDDDILSQLSDDF